MKRVLEMVFPALSVFTAVLVTAGAFFIGPLIGLIVGAAFSGIGLFTFSYLNQKSWRQTISAQLKKIEQTQKEMAAGIARTSSDLEFFKDQMTEKTLHTPPQPSGTETPKEKQQPPKRPHLIKAVEEELLHDLPAALRAEPKRGYRDLVTGQHDLSDNAVRQVVNDAVQNQRVEVFLQPIMRLPQRKVRYYEMYARVRARPGMYLPAERYLKIAREERMIQSIDRLLITEALDLIRETARLERATPFFINITPESLKSAPYMNKLLAFLGNVRALAPRLIFEMTQADFNALPAPVVDIMLALGKLGCSFSIDNVTDMNFDIEKLLRMKVQYIKIAGADLMIKGRTENGLRNALHTKKRLESHGISIIAEKIESESMIKELMDFEINYGQGNLFGKPDMQSAYAQKPGRISKFG